MEITPAPSPHPPGQKGSFNAATSPSDTAEAFEEAISEAAPHPDGIAEPNDGPEQNERARTDTKAETEASPARDQSETADEADINSDLPEKPIEAMLECWCGVTSTIGHIGATKNTAPAWGPPSIEGARSGMTSGPADSPDPPILEEGADAPPRPTDMKTERSEASFAFRPGGSGQNAMTLLEAQTGTPDSALLPPQMTSSVAVLHTPDAAPNHTLQPTGFRFGSVARQMVDAIITARDEMIEIALSPEELGRVRMVLAGSDRAPHLTIWADRAETLELMRRHGEQLLQHFRDDGMPDTMLDFRNGQQQSQHDDIPPLHDEIAEASMLVDPDLAAAAPLASIVALTVGDRRLDIRI